MPRVACRPVPSRRHVSRITAAIALVVLPVTAAGCDLPAFDSKQGSTDQGNKIFGLWQGAVLTALVIGAVVSALIIWSVLRYRRRDETIPTQRQYIVPVEVTYTIVPILIVAVIFGFSYGTQRHVDEVSGDPDFVIEVTGFQWQWQFRYVGEGVTVTGLPDDPPVMVLPVDTTVRLDLDTTDVIHSFYVPDFLNKRDAIPGVDNKIDVDVTDQGRYSGVCAEFCGLDHYKMTFEVKAVSKREFRQWLQRRQEAEG
jgi:cytochrome c oxidase subunit 2